jgi:hypothetical protein
MAWAIAANRKVGSGFRVQSGKLTLVLVAMDLDGEIPEQRVWVGSTISVSPRRSFGRSPIVLSACGNMIDQVRWARRQ